MPQTGQEVGKQHVFGFGVFAGFDDFKRIVNRKARLCIFKRIERKIILERLWAAPEAQWRFPPSASVTLTVITVLKGFPCYSALKTKIFFSTEI